MIRVTWNKDYPKRNKGCVVVGFKHVNLATEPKKKKNSDILKNNERRSYE